MMRPHAPMSTAMITLLTLSLSAVLVLIATRWVLTP
jgi:hypothetical protein